MTYLGATFLLITVYITVRFFLRILAFHSQLIHPNHLQHKQATPKEDNLFIHHANFKDVVALNNLCGQAAIQRVQAQKLTNVNARMKALLQVDDQMLQYGRKLMTLQDSIHAKQQAAPVKTPIESS